MNESLLIVAFAAIALVFLAILAVFALLLLRPWMQCFMSSAPVSLPQLVAMRLRGSPVQLICEQRIKASYVGVDLSVDKLEHAYRQGANIEKAVDALCLARRSEREVSWEDLVHTDLES